MWLFMIKAEAKFHSELMKWLKYHKKLFPKSFLIETKVVRRDSNRFPLHELSEKERRLLKQAKHGTVLQTHSDYGGMGTLCDASVISGGGFVFIKWIRRGNKTFYAIDIDKLESYEEFHSLKSLTEDDCIKICHHIGKLK